MSTPSAGRAQARVLLRRRAARLAPALAVLLAPLFFSSSGEDDAHLTFWPAHTLATRGVVVNYNGEPVEQSSSLAHVGLLAGLSRVVPVPIPNLAFAVSLLCGALAVVLAAELAAASSPQPWLAGLLAAASSSLLYWSASGMETTLAAALASAWVLASAAVLERGLAPRALLVVGLLAAAVLLVRPEGVFIATATLLGALALLLLRDRRLEGPPLRRGLALLALLGLCFAGVCLLRLVSFEALFPQPVSAKRRSLDLPSVLRGLDYLRRSALTPLTLPFWLLAAVGALRAAVEALRAPRLPLTALLCGALLVAGGGFIVLSAGDWMEPGRFLVPFVPAAAMLVLFSLRGLPQRAVVVVVLAIAALQLARGVQVAATLSTGEPLWLAVSRPPTAGGEEFTWFERSNRQRRAVLELTDRLQEIVAGLERTEQRRIQVMSGDMGVIAYHVALAHTGRVHLIDRHGLVGREFDCPAVSRAVARGRIGLKLSYEFFFAHAATIQRECGVGMPDVVFDYRYDHSSRPGRRLDNREILERYGYRSVYETRGSRASGSDLLPGVSVAYPMIIAVREDLLDALAQPGRPATAQ